MSERAAPRSPGWGSAGLLRAFGVWFSNQVNRHPAAGHGLDVLLAAVLVWRGRCIGGRRLVSGSATNHATNHLFARQ